MLRHNQEQWEKERQREIERRIQSTMDKNVRILIIQTRLRIGFDQPNE